MKARYTLIPGIITMFILLFIGCGGDSNPLDGCNELWGEQVSDEINAVFEAGAEYGQDPTLEKCEAYKDALRVYINVLKGIDSACIPAASQQDYQESITQAELDIENTDCTEETGG